MSEDSEDEVYTEGQYMMRFNLLVIVIVTTFGAFGADHVAGAAESTDGITVVSHVDIFSDEARPHAQEAAKELFNAEIKATQKDKGLISYVILMQVDKQNHFSIVETWQDSKAYEVHNASDHTITFRKNIQAYLASPFDSRMHQALK